MYILGGLSAVESSIQSSMMIEALVLLISLQNTRSGQTLDITLDRIFRIAKHLNTILLIDEADVFMENRSSYQSSHNRLVTVFLRKLEYYEGVLFLTTNRVMEFDEAVLSRIHLKIKYPELTKDARRKIWESFLSEASTSKGPAIIKVDDLKRLESMKLNGREASRNMDYVLILANLIMR